MEKVKLLAVFLSLFLLFGGVMAYTGSGDTESNEDLNSVCNDGLDNDNDGYFDGEDSDSTYQGSEDPPPEKGDSGCVKPYGYDNSEGDIWDTDMTAAMQDLSGGSPDLDKTESVFFPGEIKIGNDETTKTERTDNENTDTEALEERHIDEAFDADNSDNYGGGMEKTTSFDRSKFPDGTAFVSSTGLLGGSAFRAVDPPNSGDDTFSDIKGSEVTCGNGYEDDTEPSEPIGSEAGSDTDTPCRADYGRVWEKYDVKSPEEGSSQDSTQTDGGYCRSDDEDSSGGSLGYSCTDGDDAECTSASTGDSADSCESGSCDSPGEDGKCTERTGDDSTGSETSTADGTWNDYWSSDEGNNYWYASGESLYSDSCSVTGSWSETGEGGDSCSYSTVSYDEEDKVCETTGLGTCSGGDDTTIQGDYRDWTQSNSIDCNSNNVVDGGGDTNVGDNGAEKADNDPAGTFTDFTAYSDSSWGSDGKVWCGNESTLTVDADGPNGYGDGFVVITSGRNAPSQIRATWSPDGSDSVGKRVIVNGEDSNPRNYRQRIPNLCDGDHSVCLKYIDYYTKKGSGNKGSPDWTSVSGAVKAKEVVSLDADDSYSVCKTINKINEENGDGRELVNCDYEGNTEGSSNVAPNSGSGAIGDDPDEYWAYMEGPEINKDPLSENENHYMGDVSDIDNCILHGEEKEEGYVGNVAPPNSNDQYEKGGNSPDWEVCLNIDGGQVSETGDWDMEGDNKDHDFDDNVEEVGGEWYDLDSETAQDYLRGDIGNNGADLVPDTDIDDDGTVDKDEIGFYWHEDMNPPQDNVHNPEGGRSGTALEDDCGNVHEDLYGFSDPVQGCSDAGTEYHSDSDDGRTPTFYSFFREKEGSKRGARDEDYNSQGLNEDAGSLFTGVSNSIAVDPDNDQDEGLSLSKWNDSDGSGDNADRWAITANQAWLVSNRGTPYPPVNTSDQPTYYHPEVLKANIDRPDGFGDDSIDPDSSSVSKKHKVFANSLAVTATQSWADSNSEIQKNEGVWIDPDDLEDYSENGKIQQDWLTQLKFNIDITGPDSGLGLQTSDPGHTQPRKAVVYGDIPFEEDGLNSLEDGEFNPPMCGDDSREFLVEEMGETDISPQFEGEYACADSRNKCVYSSGGDVKFASTGTYRQAGEKDETVGRLKNDKEACVEDSRFGGVQPKWYDQDFGDIDGDGNQETCNVNSLYGKQGVRWFGKGYVSNHSHSVTGGIDDDWNRYLQQQADKGVLPASMPLTSDPDAGSWDGSTTPVPSGVTDADTDVATKGFCGGDDDGEYIVTQECNTNLCETRRGIDPVIGVAKNPDACVYDSKRSDYPDVDWDGKDENARKLYQPGEELTLDMEKDQAIQCFNGAWRDDWPVSFDRREINVPLNGSKKVGFSVINVQEQERSFKVSMVPRSHDEHPSVYQFSSFVEEDGDSFTVDVGGGESKMFHVNIHGGDRRISNEDKWDRLEIEAEAVNSGLYGSDELGVNVIRPEEARSAERSEPESVPGIGALQIAVVLTLASTVFFLQS